MYDKNNHIIQYHITNIKTEDFKDIPQVYADSFDDTPWSEDWHALPSFDVKSSWVAKVDREIVAYIISFVSKDMPYISLVAVKKDYQNMGIASNLLKECIKYWKLRLEANNDQGLQEKIGIHVDHDKVKAKKLYEKHGFKVIDIREDDTYMVLNIDENKKNKDLFVSK